MVNYRNKIHYAVVIICTILCCYVIYSYSKPDSCEVSVVDNRTVTAAELYSDGNKIAVVQSAEEVSKVVEQIKEYYMKNSGLLNIKDCVIKNKLSAITKTVNSSEVQSPEEVVSYIVSQNKEHKPLIVVAFSGESVNKMEVEPATEIKWSEELTEGESKVQEAGKKGEKAATKLLQVENAKVITLEELGEKITVKPVNTVVLKGTKINEASAAFVRPSRGSITSPFGMRWGRMHEGIDIAGNVGDPIYAFKTGVVVFAGWENGYGNMIKVRHNDGMESIYGHCSKLLVKEGTTVTKGQKIAEVGSTGNSTGPHVHFEVRVNGEPINPKEYVR